MKKIIITGTPGTGKTTFSKKLANFLGYEYLDISLFIKKYHISYKFDKEMDCSIIDIRELSLKIRHFLDDFEKDTCPIGIVIDSHLSHLLGISADICLVMVSDLKILKKRLYKRGYSEKKVQENLDAEIFDVCYNESVECGYYPHKVDSSLGEIDCSFVLSFLS
jgi:adenylate kinase